MARENGEPSRNLRSISGGKQAIPVAVVSMLVLNFGDCAAHNWATGPEMSAADFEPPKARCFLPARHGGADFAANASSNCGAGAESGHAIGNSIRTRQNLNHCMLAGGRRITDQPTAAPQPPLIAQLKGTRAQLTTRMNAIRTKPIYTALQSHLLGVDIGAFHPGANSERGQPGDHANDREIVIMISGDVYEIDSYRRNDVALMGDRLDAWQTFLGPNFPPHPPTAGPVLPEHRIGVAKHAAAV